MNEQITTEQIKMLEDNKIIPKGCPTSQINFFVEVCKRKKLDPFLKQIHLIERKERDGDNWKTSYTIQAGLDGMRAIAQRNCKIISYRRFVKKDGNETYGCCEIATGDRGLYSDEVPLSEYIQKKKDGTITHFWKQFPQTMIKKCAEESVLRMLAPEDLSGVYGDDEMEQANIETEKEIKQIPQAIKVNGADLKVFDPSSEHIEQGKYAGTLWSQIPVDYLQWMSTQKGENQVKALATLEYLKASKQTPEPDAFEGAFEDITEEDKLHYEALKQAIDTFGKKADLMKWGEDNAEEIKKLPPSLLAKLKGYYKSKLPKKGTK
jgi:phage recombination protein Bet